MILAVIHMQRLLELETIRIRNNLLWKMTNNVHLTAKQRQLTKATQSQHKFSIHFPDRYPQKIARKQVT